MNYNPRPGSGKGEWGFYKKKAFWLWCRRRIIDRKIIRADATVFPDGAGHAVFDKLILYLDDGVYELIPKLTIAGDAHIWIQEMEEETLSTICYPHEWLFVGLNHKQQMVWGCSKCDEVEIH
jgi:hypothetical protein